MEEITQKASVMEIVILQFCYAESNIDLSQSINLREIKQDSTIVNRKHNN